MSSSIVTMSSSTVSQHNFQRLARVCTTCEHHDTTLACSCATDTTRAHEGADLEDRQMRGRTGLRPVQACSVWCPAEMMLSQMFAG